MNTDNNTSTPLPVINIKAQSNHHALFLMLLSLIIMMLTLAISQGYWHQYKLVLIFIHLCTLVVFITGLAKYLQPEYSLSISPKVICYKHHYGQWKIHWHQIKRISLIKESMGIEQIQIPYIGICLLNLPSLNNQISIRLANRLIHEQKPLLAIAIKQGRLTLEQCQLCFKPFKLPSGEIIKGPLAAFFHHCNQLHKAFGCHLFIPETAIDRELGDFHRLLIQCMNSTESYQHHENDLIN